MTWPTPPGRDAPLRVLQEVADALAAQRAVVGLETAVLTHGLPRESWHALQARLPALGEAPQWLDPCDPLHLAAVGAMADAVREEGATPAVIAVLDGAACVGTEDAGLRRLAADPSACKLAARDLAAAIARGASGGTTVSASLTLCAPAGIRVFATGGIGGVHRGWTERPDISADLLALSRHAMCVVCAGAKSVLDLPATVEALEALSIPVVGWRCDEWPRFVSPADPDMPVPRRLDEADDIARLCRAHWALGGGAVLVVQPVDPGEAIEEPLTDDIGSIGAPSGPMATPALLGRLVERTGGRSLRANVHLLRRNAALGAKIARSIGAAT